MTGMHVALARTHAHGSYARGRSKCARDGLCRRPHLLRREVRLGRIPVRSFAPGSKLPGLAEAQSGVVKNPGALVARPIPPGCSPYPLAVTADRPRHRFQRGETAANLAANDSTSLTFRGCVSARSALSFSRFLRAG